MSVVTTTTPGREHLGSPRLPRSTPVARVIAIDSAEHAGPGLGESQEAASLLQPLTGCVDQLG